MSDSSRIQRLEEGHLFMVFCRQVPGLGVNLRSIRRGNHVSHEPDFVCRTKSGATLTFELCELATPEIKRQVRLLGLDHWLLLPPAEAAKFHAQFGAMDFNLDTPPGNGRKVVTAVLSYLRQLGPERVLPASAAGSTMPYSCIPGLKGTEGAVHVKANAGGYIGPIFNIRAVTSFGSVVEDAIRNKVTKTYQLGGGRVDPQLLLYYSHDDPFVRGQGWEEQPDGYRDLWESRFTDVWMFMENPPEVLSHYMRGDGLKPASEPQL